MVFSDTDNENNLKPEDIQLDIRVSKNLVLTIPEKRSNAYSLVPILIHIVNNARFSIPYPEYIPLTPEIVSLEGQILQRFTSDNEPENPRYCNPNYPIQLGQGGMIYLDAKLRWQDDKLKLEIPAKSSPWLHTSPDLSQSEDGTEAEMAVWIFEELQPSTYQLRFFYNPATWNLANSLGGTRKAKRTVTIESKQLATSFVDFSLVQPQKTTLNAVEVDGIRFETLAPEQVFSIPINLVKSSSRLGTPSFTNAITIRLGIRITNHTSIPFYFCFYGCLTPELFTLDGQAIEAGLYINGVKFPEETDYLLVRPEDTLSFFPTAILSRQDNELQLGIYWGNGGYVDFLYLKPGLYRFRFRYYTLAPIVEKTSRPGRAIEIIERELSEQVWKGEVYTPFVEVSLA